MQSRRLARLVRIIVQVSTHPRKSPEALARELGISIRQFYYDRDQLARMGILFSRKKGRFVVLDEPAVTFAGLPLSGFMVFMAAVCRLFAANDFAVVRTCLEALFAVVDHVSGPQKPLLKSLVQDAIITDGLGCRPELLDDLLLAIDEKKRILIHSNKDPAEKPLLADPYGLSFKNARLCLDAYAVEEKKQLRLPLADMDKITMTVFYRPQPVCSEHSRQDGKNGG
ncbi:MAG: hypothetical protein JRI36_03020 [Deltaproteobacteria bacterium]|nr:hypothetical protein [Deltaproteobacteria bacterium]